MHGFETGLVGLVAANHDCWACTGFDTRVGQSVIEGFGPEFGNRWCDTPLPMDYESNGTESAPVFAYN